MVTAEVALAREYAADGAAVRAAEASRTTNGANHALLPLSGNCGMPLIGQRDWIATFGVVLTMEETSGVTEPDHNGDECADCHDREPDVEHAGPIRRPI